MAKKNILLTCGRSPATLYIARIFKQSGHHVYIAESIKSHICRFSNAVKKSFHVPSPNIDKRGYIDNLLNIVKHHHIDLVIPIFEEVFYISSELDKFSKVTQVFSDHFDKLDQLHNKFLFIQLLKKIGMAVPDSVLVNSLDEYDEYVKNGKIRYPHVLKLVYSRSSAKVQFVFKPEKIELDISQNKPCVLQEYIPGTLICTYSICHQGDVLAHTAYKNLYNLANGAGINFTFVENESICKWITQVVKKLNFTGQIAFDFILSSDDRIWPIECNPRTTSGIYMFNSKQKIVDAFLFNRPVAKHVAMKERPMIGLAMFIYALPNIKSIKEFIKWLKNIALSKDVIFRWQDPFPFLYQFFSAFRFLKFSRKYHISLIEAITYDLEWNGGE